MSYSNSPVEPDLRDVIKSNDKFYEVQSICRRSNTINSKPIFIYILNTVRLEGSEHYSEIYKKFQDLRNVELVRRDDLPVEYQLSMCPECVLIY